MLSAFIVLGLSEAHLTSNVAPGQAPLSQALRCTADGSDPYGTGHFVECCSGMKKCLERSANWEYRCKSCSDTCSSDSGWNNRACVGGGGGNVPSPTPSPGPSGGSTSKKGVAMNPRDCHSSDVEKLGASWWYSWGHTPPCSVSGAEFVPMIWSGSHISAVKALPGGSDWLLGFNEPNLSSQSNMSPQECARLWPQLEATGRKLVSPAMAMSSTAVNWMQTFLDSCRGCRVDAIAIHIYENNMGGFDYWLKEFKKFGKPIWVTEVANAGGDTSASASMAKSVAQTCEDDSQVQRYSWFMNRGDGGNLHDSSLISSNGELTSVGRAYADVSY